MHAWSGARDLQHEPTTLSAVSHVLHNHRHALTGLLSPHDCGLVSMHF